MVFHSSALNLSTDGMDRVLRPRVDLLLMVPLTASPTNAIEMNNAMTSSVDLENNENQPKLGVISHVLS